MTISKTHQIVTMIHINESNEIIFIHLQSLPISFLSSSICKVHPTNINIKENTIKIRYKKIESSTNRILLLLSAEYPEIIQHNNPTINALFFIIVRFFSLCCGNSYNLCHNRLIMYSCISYYNILDMHIKNTIPYSENPLFAKNSR